MVDQPQWSVVFVLVTFDFSFCHSPVHVYTTLYHCGAQRQAVLINIYVEAAADAWTRSVS